MNNDTECAIIVSLDIESSPIERNFFVAEKNKRGLKPVKTNFEEIDEKVREHRRTIIRRTLQVVGILVAIVVVVELFYALRSFESYEVRSSIDRNGSSDAQFCEFQNYILEYSNDGISCVTHEREFVWNQSYEMTRPRVTICGDYLAVYDNGGNEVLIMTESGLQKQIKTTVPIETVCVAEQGTIAVLMREGTEAQVKLFDKKGTELANGKFYGSKGSFPIDIALSKDATKLAVNMIDISQGEVSTTISFYNFGSVGQSEIDNNVGTYTYEGLLIPEIAYVSNSRMIAVGTGKILIFEGAQKPTLEREILIDQEIKSSFYNDKYVGIVYDNPAMENTWCIEVMDFKGNVIMENDISIPYERIEFLSNNEICVTNDAECEIFTIHSIRKFAYEFDKKLCRILAGGGRQSYTFIFEETTEEVILK